MGDTVINVLYMICGVSIPWVFSAIALTGTVMNAKKNKAGFILWLISNCYMAIVNFGHHEYAIGTLFVVYFLLAAYGLWNWSKPNAGNETYQLFDDEYNYFVCQNCQSFSLRKERFCNKCGKKIKNFEEEGKEEKERN